MITETLLMILKAIIGTFHSFAGDWEWHFPQFFLQMCTDMLTFDDIMPVHEVFDCLFLTGIYWFLLLGWYLFSKFIDWVTNIIP